MKTTTPTSRAAVSVGFHADICWLGPIIGAAPGVDGQDVKIAGAEDPALGKAFVAAMVRVKVNGNHYEQVDEQAYFPEEWESDRHGWFATKAPADLWHAPAVGVLVVMLYNRSRDLAYYAFKDWHPLEEVRGRRAFKGSSATRPAATVLPDMPDDVRDGIGKAIAEAIAELLGRQTAEDLLKGLAELNPPLPSASGDDRELALAVASCQYPSAMLESEVAGASYGRLAARLDERTPPRPQALLLVGDQIYVDGTAGLFDPTSQYDRFVRPYEILFRMKNVRSVLRRLPAFMMLDDHEIVDNWEPRVDDKRPDAAMTEGRRSYLKFQRRAGPGRKLAVSDSRHPIWYTFEMNGFPVFMADTRTERMARTAPEIATARIMSKGQMSALLCWLSNQPEDIPKVVATPSILLPRHARAVQRDLLASALRSDGWDGYPRSLHRVLAHIAHEKIRNVVFLSGDEHLSCVSRVEVRAEGADPVVIHSVHSSPLFAPFPFANSVRADLVASDDFEFRPARDGDDTDGDKAADCRVPNVHGVFNCRVDTEFAAPGDGFAVLRFHRDGAKWVMDCDFDRAVDPNVGAAHLAKDGATRIVRALA